MNAYQGKVSIYHQDVIIIIHLFILTQKNVRAVIKVEFESNNHGKTYTLYRNLDNYSHLSDIMYLHIYRKIVRISIFFWGGGLRMFSIFYSHIEKNIDLGMVHRYKSQFPF